MKKHSFLFLLCLLGLSFTFVSCSKDDDDKSSSSPSAKYYFNGSFGSQTVNLQVTSTGNVSAGTGINSILGIDSTQCAWGGAIYSENSSGDITESWGVDFQTLTSTTGSFDESEFNSLFNLGDYPFVAVDNLGPDGVVVAGDRDSVFYTSVPPPGQSQPSTSKLTLTSVTKIPAAGFNSAYVEVKGTVKVTVWSKDPMLGYTGGSGVLDATFSLLILKE